MTTSEAAAALRDRSVRGDFAGAEAALRCYTNLLQPLLADLPPAEAARRLSDACELIEWSRRNLCAARAHVADEIRRLDSISQYHQRLVEAERALRAEG